MKRRDSMWHIGLFAVGPPIALALALWVALPAGSRLAAQDEADREQEQEEDEEPAVEEEPEPDNEPRPEDEPPSDGTPPTRPLTGRALLEEAYAASDSAETEEEYDAILEKCRRAFEMDLDEGQVAYANSLMAWTLNRRGEVRAAAGKEDEALVDFEEAVALDGNRWKAVYNRGVSYANAGRLDEALADFNRTVALKPEFVKARFNRAEVRFALGQVQDSLEDYSETIRLAPDHSEAYTCRGFAHYSLGDVQAALNDFNQAIRLDSNNATAYVNRGDVFGDQGNFARATQDYRRALEIDPRSARAYLSWGWLMATCPLEQYRNADMALQYAQAAVKLVGEEHYRYLAVLAAAHANAGQFDEAQAVQARVIDLAPAEERPAQQKRLELYASSQPLRDVKEPERAMP
jgi:tetratricopeptide (TPR) repeat protein